MSVQTISSTMRKARKDHEDSAGVWIRNYLEDLKTDGRLSFSDWRAIAKLKAKGWKIKKGEMYQDNVCKQDGDIYSFRCDPVINKICWKLDMYADC